MGVYKQRKLWTKDYILVLIIAVMISWVPSMLTPVMTPYVNDLGSGTTVAGLVMGIFAFSALASRPLFGNIIDQYGRRVILIIGSIITIAGAVLLNLIQTIPFLIISRFIQGVGFSALTTALGTAAADLSPRERLAEAIGYYSVCSTVSAATGPALGLKIYAEFNYIVLFSVLTAVSVIVLAISLFINYEKNQSTELPVYESYQKKRIELKRVFAFRIAKQAIVPSLAAFFIVITFSAIMAYMPAHAMSRGFDNPGAFFLVYAAAALLTRTFAGKIADRHGFNLMIVPGIIVLIASMLLLAFLRSNWMLILSAILFGLGFGTVQPLFNTMAIELSPQEHRGAASATFFFAMDTGIGIGSILFGYVSEKLGYAWVFVLSSVFVIMALVFYFLLIFPKLKKVKSTIQEK